MEKSEALLYLPLKDGESVEDVYEQKVFEWKNFFVNRFPVTKLFKKKMEQLQKLEEAYLALGGTRKEVAEATGGGSEYDAHFKESFLKYHQDRNFMKQRLFAAHSAIQIKTIAEGLLVYTSALAKVWSSSDLDTARVVVSKEVDPMDLLAAIDDAASKGVYTITDIGKLPEGHLVLNEAKRLSLWAKMESDE